MFRNLSPIAKKDRWRDKAGEKTKLESQGFENDTEAVWAWLIL